MHAITFPAREVFYFFLLIRPGKVEPRAVATRVDLDLAKLHRVLAVRNDFIYGLIPVEASILIHVAQLHRLADYDGASIGFFFSNDHLEHGRLAGTVRANHTDDSTLWEVEIHMLIEHVLSEGLADPARFDDHVTQPWAGRNKDLEILSHHVLLLINQLLIAIQARLALRLARLGRHPDPFQFVLEGFPSFRLCLLFLF